LLEDIRVVKDDALCGFRVSPRLVCPNRFNYGSDLVRWKLGAKKHRRCIVHGVSDTVPDRELLDVLRPMPYKNP
jgi:hypothetical protein